MIFSQTNKYFYLTSLLIISFLFTLTSSRALAITKMNINKNISNKINMNNPNDDLAEKLANGFYGDMFNYYLRESVINKIWYQPNSRQRLLKIVNDKNAPMKARFLACEVLHKRNLGFIRYVGSETVGEIYVNALLNNYTGMANSWGFLYELNDAGPVGIQFILLGEEILPILIPLLDNNKPMGLYRGSKEATLGNSYQYRIKDFAAYYISRIKRIPVKFHQDFAERDAEIEKLKAALANEAK